MLDLTSISEETLSLLKENGFRYISMDGDGEINAHREQPWLTSMDVPDHDPLYFWKAQTEDDYYYITTLDYQEYLPGYVVVGMIKEL